MTGYVEQHWARCAPWLQAALDHAGGLFGLEDVRARCEDGRAALLAMPRAAIVMEIVDYPRARVARVWLAGGEIADVRAAEPVVEAWARAEGATVFEFVGRPGWERVFGMRRAAVVSRRAIV